MAVNCVLSGQKKFDIQGFKSRSLASAIVQMLDIAISDSNGIKRVTKEFLDGMSYLTLRQAVHFVNNTVNCSFEIKNDIITFTSRSII